MLEHPDLNGASVQLEGLPDEVAPAIDAALTVAIFEVHVPGQTPRRLVVDAGDFDALSTSKPMRDLLKDAPTVMPARRPANGGNGTRYATLQHAGTPHRGQVTSEEARIVREHLTEVNARLAVDGLRQIDPSNPADAARYGFTLPASDFKSASEGP